MKKLFKKYGATVIFYSGIIAIFVLGFIVGAYGRSAPDAETADFYNDKIKCEASSGTKVETASTEAAQHTEYTEIMGIKIPVITIPVKPGRNLAIILEIAAMNNRQKKMGYNTAEEFNKKLMEQMGVEQ